MQGGFVAFPDKTSGTSDQPGSLQPGREVLIRGRLGHLGKPRATSARKRGLRRRRQGPRIPLQQPRPPGGPPPIAGIGLRNRL